MKKNGYKYIILQFLQDHPDKWVLGREMRGIQTSYGWIGERGKRDCRDLVEMGYLYRKTNDKKEVLYKFKKMPVESKEPEMTEKELVIHSMG